MSIIFSGLGFCGMMIIISIYFLIRNEWVSKVKGEMIDKVYAYNMKLLEKHEYNKLHAKSYDDLPEHNYILYRKPFCWDKKIL